MVCTKEFLTGGEGEKKKEYRIKKIEHKSGVSDSFSLVDIGSSFDCSGPDCMSKAYRYLKTKPAANQFSNSNCSLFLNNGRREAICGDLITRHIKSATVKPP